MRAGRTIALSLAVVALGAVLAGAAYAQDGPSSMVSDGTVGEGSRPVGEGSGSVYDSGHRGMLSGPLGASSGPVGARSRGMLSPSIGDVTVGSALSGRPVSGGGSISASSSGAITQQPPRHFDRPVSESELQQLQEQLRGIQPLPE
jgi:hypothetical protein